MNQVLPDVYRRRSSLPGPHQPAVSYACVTDLGTVLIDPAADLTPDVLAGLPPVTHVFVTHVQEEHAAGAAHWPGVPLLVPEGDECLCRGGAAYATPWPPPWDWEGRGNYLGHLAGALNERPPREMLPVMGTLRPGHSPLPNWNVIATPGQGKHAVTLVWVSPNGTVGFCGDAVYEGGRLWNWFDADWDYGAQSGQRTLLASAERLAADPPHVLCPAHGGVITDPGAALNALITRLRDVLAPTPSVLGATVNFAEVDSPAPGFRRLLPSLHQWRTGNCAVLVSQTGNALLVDDGLCHWAPLPERRAHHRQVIADLKRTLGVTKIEVIVPTHYHGDHVENVPALVADEGTEVVALDVVADVLADPRAYNLACPLPWYGTGNDTVPIHRAVPSGTRWTWHEYEMELFHLGGQTYYHLGLAVLVDGLRVLFVGDSFHGELSDCEPVLCYNDAEPSGRGWVYALDRMIERTPDLLVCGHGNAVRDPLPHLRRSRAAWDIRLAQYDALMARGDRRLFFDPFWQASDQPDAESRQ